VRLAHGGEALERVAVTLAQGFASGDDTVGSGFTADLCDCSPGEQECCSEQGRP